MDADESTSTLTEPGIPRKGRKKKPLRTYGKRTASEKDSRPSAKRQKASPEELVEEGIDGNSASSLPDGVKTDSIVMATRQDGIVSPPHCLPPTNPAVPKKGTILSYFKPKPAPSSTPPSDCPSTNMEENFKPPSSPPPPEIRRFPRRLTTRPTMTDDRDTSIDSQGRTSCPSPSSITSGRKKVRAKKAVQTTLNLSLQGDLTECKICDMLYNSVHPKDVKLHARRHAATLKQRELQQSTEQDD